MRKWKGWRNTMANNKELDRELLRKMFNDVRSAEIRNIKIQKNDDKRMVSLIEKYVVKTVEGEIKDED